jgi:tRNA threonylcarbamoyladenosine biosynthesis protein TsaB
VLILAFDCSSPASSVALLEGSFVLAREALDSTKRSAVTLAPAIAEVLRLAGKASGELDLMATTIGPGSFTGLRVGVTMAKTLAYALQCDLVGLNTLDVLATQALEAGLGGDRGIIHAALDAQRKELFVGRYRVSAENPGRLCRSNDGDTILSTDAWLRSLQAGDVVTGSGLMRWKDQLPPGVVIAPSECFEADAVTIGRLALREHEAGRRDNLWTFSPLYIRPSYADEKRQPT